MAVISGVLQCFCLKPKFGERVSSDFGYARAAQTHFQRAMRQYFGALVLEFTQGAGARLQRAA
ncbi:hypothetical protein ABIE62_001988 [Porphyrobacter sp. MBR-155]|jgi:hypothetical protein|uniref:hypothetical protein n=1 Tax=Porphyrobacter sp. MBR-155 TaxID=3156464 RepID=UPI003397E369